ncbi:MAG TPA: glycosyltransferase family 9 protein, partial [Candidatus Acidoferrales bacterium]|nr:glycosyltransferase family 9 protein [Candidatus Acidoferrales bacterium]
MARILVIQLGRLGDVIQTTPLLRELIHENHAGCIDVLVFDSLREIVAGIGLRKIYSFSERALPLTLRQLDRTIEENRKQLGGVPREAHEALQSLALPAYDRIVNCSYSPLGAFVTQNTRSESVTGPVITAAGEILFHHPAQIYLCARANFRDHNWFNLVDLWRASGHPYQNKRSPFIARPHVPVASEVPFDIPPGRIVALNPGSSDAVRRWPPGEFASLAEELVAHGLVPALVGAPSDRETCAEVESRSAVPIANFCGRTSVPQLAFFLTRSDLLVSNDTGAIHIAAAVGCRSLSLFGSTAYFAETAPWAAGHVILQGPLGSDLVLLHPKLVLASALYCLELIDVDTLRTETARQNASAWETFVLAPQTDPLGGISYKPLHSDHLSSDQIFARELRHLFAQVFSNAWDVSGVGDRAHLNGEFANRRILAPSNERDPAIALALAALESMAEAAARCGVLCARQTRESAAEIMSL